MMEDKFGCRIQSTDGIAYILLKSGECGFLMVQLQEDDGKEYIIALEPQRQGNDKYHWEQARYFKSKEAAEKAFAVLENHILNKGRTVFKRQSVSVMREVSKMMANGYTADEIYRRYGREALLKTLASIAISRPRIAKEVKAWAAGRTNAPLLIGITPTNEQIFKTWKDAYEMRLF